MARLTTVDFSEKYIDEFSVIDELKKYQIFVTSKTLANWRWKGSGPDWVRISMRVSYPASGIAKWAEENVKINCENSTDYQKKKAKK